MPEQTLDRDRQLARFAQFEKRAIFLYRAFAQRFAGQPALSALWREMSDVEAAHFAILTLAGETVHGDQVLAQTAAAFDPQAVEAADRSLAEAEGRAKAGTLTAGEAVEIAVALESGELPRIEDLLGWLPPRALASVRDAITGPLEAHFACLARLAELSARRDLIPEIERLRTKAQALRGR
jgi:hypothetical protein